MNSRIMPASCSGRPLEYVQIPQRCHALAQRGPFIHASRGCDWKKSIPLSDTRCRSFLPANVISKTRQVTVKASSEDKEDRSKISTEFGYSRKDVLLIGFGLIALGYALYYGAQALGVEATTAGNYVQLAIFLLICVGYISTYLLRVANKDMTYTKQLEQYEQRVMQKRLEEMPQTERERLMDEVETERERRSGKSS